MGNTETLINLIQGVAAAIREKTGKSDLLTLDQMPSEILSISGGGDLTFDQVISRTYTDLNINDLSVVLQQMSSKDSTNEQLNQFLLMNSTFKNLYIENLQLNSVNSDDNSSFIHNSTFNSLTINNFTLTNPSGMTSQNQSLFFDNPRISDPTQSLRINNINSVNNFYFNFTCPVKCLFLNLQNVQNNIFLRQFPYINKLILTNNDTSFMPLQVSFSSSNVQEVYCSIDTNPSFQQNIQGIFPQVQFIPNEECENLWDTEIMVQP